MCKIILADMYKYLRRDDTNQRQLLWIGSPVMLVEYNNRQSCQSETRRTTHAPPCCHQRNNCNGRGRPSNFDRIDHCSTIRHAKGLIRRDYLSLMQPAPPRRIFCARSSVMPLTSILRSFPVVISRRPDAKKVYICCGYFRLDVVHLNRCGRVV